MLVLTRRTGQQIVVPDANVTITVLEFKGKRVRLGISAPQGTAVHRREIWERMCPSVHDPAVPYVGPPTVGEEPRKPR